MSGGGKVTGRSSRRGITHPARRRAALCAVCLTILLHPNTDDPRADHLYFTLWVNRSQPVNAYGMKKPGPGQPRVERVLPNTKPTIKLEV